jgi:methionyl-tRNA synthetase
MNTLSQNPWFLLLALLWILPWKGYALWTASKKSHRVWFVVLLLVNTIGILDIFYIFYVAKRNWKDIKRIVMKPKTENSKD